MQETPVQFLGREDPLEKGRLPTPVFGPTEFHGLYSPWGHKESDTAEWLSLSLSKGRRQDKRSGEASWSKELGWACSSVGLRR